MAAPPGATRAADARPKRAYVLPPSLRAELARPFGPVVATSGLLSAIGKAAPVLAVGDVVSLTCLEVGLAPRLFLCDYKTQRGSGAGAIPPSHFRTQLSKWGSKEVRVRNEAGQVSREAWDAIRAALADDAPSPIRIVVEGEEDLLGLPCFLEAPLGAAVLYGMPGEGVTVVHVTRELQEQVRSLLARFDQA